MNTATKETEKCLLVFYDDVPEILMAGVACRRVGRRAYRVINCPFCNHPLTEVGKNAKVELYRYPSKKRLRCHAYPICRTCRNEVGMILA